MRILRGTLALLLSYALGLEPALAQVQSVPLAAPAASAAGGAAASVTSGSARTLAPALLSVAPVLSLAPSLATPSLAAPSLGAAASAAPAAAPAASAAEALSVAAPASAALAAAAAAATPAASAAPAAASAPERLAQIRGAADSAVANLGRASGGAARAQAGAQFAALTGERWASAAAGADDATPPASASGGKAAPALEKPSGKTGEEKAGPPAPKLGLTQVFHDPQRNKWFWRYVGGYTNFLLGFEMYVVGLPYLISSITVNALKERGDPRANDPKIVTELVRSNRSLVRIAHWFAQGLSYVLIPLFTRDKQGQATLKWWVRSYFIRAAVFVGVPALFFATGVLGPQAAIALLCVLAAGQSFFQGVSVTTEGGATTRLLGDKSVTPEERTKANSILTFVGAAIAVLGPLLAGQVARLGPVHGKTGVGGAVIYGIYAGTLALAGLIFSTIKLFREKDAKAAGADAASGAAPGAAPRSLGGTLKSLWSSIKDGLRIVFKDRLLRTMLILSTMGSLFSDPLVFNVLPEYIDALAAKNGSLGALMHVPVLGWFMHTLTASPMGNFALMVVMASFGGMIATALMKPLTRLMSRFGFKTEEALTVPFYFIAALEAPLFLLMTHMPFLLGAVALYGLQALSVGFIGISISGLYQKNLGEHKDNDVSKILAAESLLGIVAAIISTFAYGFLLKGIALSTSLIIAAAATGVVSLIRVAAPFLSFTKRQRRPPDPKDPKGSVLDEAPETRVPPAHATPSTGDHNGPNSILSTHL